MAVSLSSRRDAVHHVFSEDAVHGPRALANSRNVEDPRHRNAPHVLLGRPRRIRPNGGIPLHSVVEASLNIREGTLRREHGDRRGSTTPPARPAIAIMRRVKSNSTPNRGRGFPIEA